MTLLGCRTEFLDYSLGGKSAPTRLYEWVLDLQSGGVSERVVLDNRLVEFPTINPSLLGRQTRYVYLTNISPPAPGKIDGILKYDMQTGRFTEHTFVDQQEGGEALFIPRPGGTSEDDGLLVTFVWNRQAGSSECYFINAMSMDVVARVQLPNRVPFGFHGSWIPGDHEV